MPQKLKPWRITANIPATLRPIVKQLVYDYDYDTGAQYLLGLVLADLAGQPPHQVMPILLNKPKRFIDAFVDALVLQWERKQLQRALTGMLRS